MVFCSLTFLFLFLPLVLLCYYAVPAEKIMWRNAVLLCFSLLFYAYGEPSFFVPLLLLLAVNYALLLGMLRFKPRLCFAAAVVVNLSVLFVYKYLDFGLEIASAVSRRPFQPFGLALPLGISFFIFQVLSYAIDYKRLLTSPNSELLTSNALSSRQQPLLYALYVLLFPQLIAGPIVRYTHVGSQLLKRVHSVSLFSSGIDRFVIGLSKKVLLADAFGEVATRIFGLDCAIQDSAQAWCGALAVSLQIYYDFSGYSDMAIGLCRMFGIRLEENFRYPYAACSVTDFWRRWHISLTSWFKDYVYVPLGGSRRGWFRRLVNITVVWVLCGLWHGAAWNFFLWGCYFAVLLIVEKQWLGGLFQRRKWLGYLFMCITVLHGWVLFSTSSLTHAWHYVQALWAFQRVPQFYFEFFILQNKLEWVCGFLFATPFLTRFAQRKWVGLLRVPVVLLLFALSIASVLQNDFHPFLYFRF